MTYLFIIATFKARASHGKIKQAEAEVVPSSSLVEVGVGVEVGVEVGLRLESRCC